MIPRFELAQAEEIRNALARHRVRYLVIGTSGMILLGYPDTTRDCDLFLDKSPQNRIAAIAALGELGFAVTVEKAERIRRCDFFVPLHCGPFALDLNFSPQGIPSFDEAWARHVEVERIPICHPNDIIASKAAANRNKDRDALPRLRDFRDGWLKNRNGNGASTLACLLNCPHVKARES